jgi:hypothetical protein
MDITQIQTKSKEFTIAMIDANEQAFNAGVKAFNKFIGTDYATYTYGLTYMGSELSKNARKIVEEFSDLAPAGNKE